MFKSGSFEDEIYNSMQKKLGSSQLENKYSFDKLSKAADLLNSAASLFEKAGMFSESEEIIKILSKLSTSLQGKK